MSSSSVGGKWLAREKQQSAPTPPEAGDSERRLIPPATFNLRDLLTEEELIALVHWSQSLPSHPAPMPATEQ